MNGTLLESAQRDVTTPSEDVRSVSGQRGALLFLNITEMPPVPREKVEEETVEEESELALEEAFANSTLQVEIQVRDPASGNYQRMALFPATPVASVLREADPGDLTKIYAIYPAIFVEATDNFAVVGLSLPPKWRARVFHSQGAQWVYSLGVAPLC